ncbi:nuclear transport factor 2 family protein [Amycolatopsis sp. NPDC051758]|uniref:nuclear transport factor 2 family protein n=1 Tax=Amycolatopsis sp. NPDC051758 TaxID=3363935 RepID=UPI00378D92F7
MEDATGRAELRAAEDRLQAAQLAGDVEELDRLLDDRVCFAIGAELQTKQDDLDGHRSGRQKVTRLVEEDLRIFVDGGTGVTWFLGQVAAVVDGQPIEARMRYTRTWLRTDVGWRVVAAHIAPA